MITTTPFLVLLLVAWGAVAIPVDQSNTRAIAQQDLFNTTLFPTYYRFAAISYTKDAKLVTAWNCPLCKDPSVADTRNATFTPSRDDGKEQGYIAVSPSLKTIVFAVDGSNTVEEWLNNLKIWKQDLSVRGCASGIEVHVGFWDVWTQLRPTMEPVLVKYLKAFPDYSVSFIGHSLGGAVTLLAAVDFVNRGVVPASRSTLVSFGQPRVGNVEFAQCISKLGFKQVARVVNKSDIVIHLPPWFLDYRHHYHEYWINKAGVLITNCNDNPNGKEADNCARTQDTKLSIPDHKSYFGIKNP
ncbi:hypothetical protein HDU78_003665 [Chytriomyces hyalinus]|nr:hypothetical protein HDU78_003665 [Chytriomyces hyalinus]KAJ3263072.1 hypothetical protein HDU77_011343 [Chytriomyces hyalinus]